MDFFNFLTLAALALSIYGTANVYKGKADGKGLGKGIVSLAIGIFSVCWLNPVFPKSVFFSLLIALAFTTLLLGYTADAFSKAGKSEIVNIEILGKEDGEKPRTEDGIMIDVKAEEKEDEGKRIMDLFSSPPGESLRDLVRMIQKKKD